MKLGGNYPVMMAMCATCPWRDGSPYAYLQNELAMSAITTTNRICHCTGGPNAIHDGGTGKAPRICRGARNLQLRMFTSLGLFKEPTDAEWARVAKEISERP